MNPMFFAAESYVMRAQPKMGNATHDSFRSHKSRRIAVLLLLLSIVFSGFWPSEQAAAQVRTLEVTKVKLL
jgi:hypothetical protein